MTALVRSTLAVAAVAGLLAVAGAPVTAQKKDAPKAKPGVVEVKQGKDDKYRLTIRDADGKFLAMSGAFATKADALKGLDILKDALKDAKVVEVKGGGKDDDEEMKDEKKPADKKKKGGG